MVDIYPKWNTFILVPIITTFIDKCLETIYKYNDLIAFTYTSLTRQ